MREESPTAWKSNIWVCGVAKKWGFSVTSLSKPKEVVGVPEPMLLTEVAVYVVRTQSDLPLQRRRLRVLLRLQRNRVGRYCGLRFDIAIGACTVAVVRIAGLAELGLEMCFGLELGILGLLL
jgi:hypothetical protein